MAEPLDPKPKSRISWFANVAFYVWLLSLTGLVVLFSKQPQLLDNPLGIALLWRGISPFMKIVGMLGVCCGVVSLVRKEPRIILAIFSIGLNALSLL